MINLNPRYTTMNENDDRKIKEKTKDSEGTGFPSKCYFSLILLQE